MAKSTGGGGRSKAALEKRRKKLVAEYSRLRGNGRNPNPQNRARLAQIRRKLQEVTFQVDTIEMDAWNKIRWAAEARKPAARQRRRTRR